MAGFIFSTYPTANWKNSDYLPPGVTNTNKDGADNAAKMDLIASGRSSAGLYKKPSTHQPGILRMQLLNLPRPIPLQQQILLPKDGTPHHKAGMIMWPHLL